MALTTTQRRVARAWLRDRFSVRDYDGILDMIVATGAQQLATLKAFAAAQLDVATAQAAQAAAESTEAAERKAALEEIIA